MDQQTTIIVSVFGASSALLFVLVVALFIRLNSLHRLVDKMQVTGRIRVQKLKMNPDKNYAFHNPALTPDEELSRRGYSMYANEDLESAREPERQTGGQFVDELAKEIDSRQTRQNAPPFLLQSIEENKRKSRSLANPVANSRQSETNPNFIY